MKSFIKIFVVSLFLTNIARAGELRFASVFTSNMVLQQNEMVSLWGYGDCNTDVCFKASWNNNIIKTTTDNTGKWSVAIKTPKGSFNNYSLEVFCNGGQQHQKLENILVGEVWLCSGQSNMEMILQNDPKWNLYVKDAAKEIENANYPFIRFINVQRNEAYEPLRDITGYTWKVCSPETVGWLSAAAYFFARNIHKQLDVPVGIISCSYGGSPIQSWLPGYITSNSFYAKEQIRIGKYRHDPDHKKPEYDMLSALYNAMLSPFTGYTIKGFLWYQGESNVGDARRYVRMMKDLVFSWRRDWNKELPFYFVQIAPFVYPGYQAQKWSELAEAQRKAEDVISNSKMIVISDCGEPDNIHPSRKQEVGNRLADVALKYSYNKNTFCSYPEPCGCWLKDGIVQIKFKNAGEKLNALDNRSDMFEISADGVTFSKADASVSGNRVYIDGGNTQPLYVRYVWHDESKSDIFNSYGLPVGPFRLKISK